MLFAAFPTEVHVQFLLRLVSVESKALTAWAALAVALALQACGGSDSPADAGNPFCAASQPSPGCSPPGTPSLVAGGTVGPMTAPPNGSCQKPVGTPSYPQGQVQDLGTHKVGEVLNFNVAQGAGSLSIISQAVNATASITFGGSSIDNTVVPTGLTEPNGTKIYDDLTAPDAGMEDLATVFYAGSSPATGAMTVPNASPLLASSCAGLPAGSWSVTVSDFAFDCFTNKDPNCTGANNTNTYAISVLTRSGVTPSTGTLDVAFYLVGAGSLTSATAILDVHVKRLVSSLSSLYAAAGLCLGTVTFYDVPAWAQSRYGTGIDADKEGPCDNLDQMFTLAQPGNTLNYFLVGQIASTGTGGTVVGIDGTIPGPSAVGGTIHSGAAVSAADLSSGACTGGLDLINCGADRVAYIAAHEGGHWMGLYHPTEADGESFDPIHDTPTCGCEACATTKDLPNCATAGKTPRPAMPAFVFPESCLMSSGQCGGGDELMFWQLSEGIAQGRITSEQSQLMRSNPLVH